MRWIFRLLGVIVVVVLMGGAALFLLPADRIAQLAARQFEAVTGRALTIAGPVTPTFWPVLGARVEGVTLANVAGSDAGPMLMADAVDLGVDLSALMGGSLVVRRFEARNPQIVLERAADGTGNWVFAGLGEASAPSGNAAPLPPIALERAQISGASLRYIDHAAGTDVVIEGVSVDLSMPDTGGAATLRIAVARNGRQAEAEIALGSVSALLEGGVVSLSARLSAEGAEGRFEGRGGIDPVAAEGRVQIDIAALNPLLELAGASGPEVLPQALRPLSLVGQVTLAPTGSLHLREGVLGAGPNRLALALDATFDGPRPMIAGQISADRLDLTGFAASGEGGGGGAAGWPTTPFDASALGLADARVGLNFGPIDTGSGVIDTLRATLVNDRSRAVLTLAELRAFEGLVTGEVIANNRDGFSTRLNLALRDLGLLPMLRATADFERLSGTAAMDLSLLASGNSVAALMRNLSGEGRLAFGQGEIIGFDLAGMLASLDASHIGPGNSTIYDSINASFTVSGGVLDNRDLRLISRFVEVTGEGTVDIGGQTLAYRVTPEALRNADTGESLRVPLLITGPWAEPRFRLDLEGLAEQRLAEERERLEARAREEVQRLEDEARARAEQALQERLGVTPAEGQSVEEAVEQGLEDRAREEILRRLGVLPPEPAPQPAPAGN